MSLRRLEPIERSNLLSAVKHGGGTTDGEGALPRHATARIGLHDDARPAEADERIPACEPLYRSQKRCVDGWRVAVLPHQGRGHRGEVEPVFHDAGFRWGMP